MKKRKKIKDRLMAIALAAVVVVMYCMPGTALAEEDVPSNGTITVTNADPKAESAKAYQIVKAEYEDKSFKDWKAANGDIEKIFTKEGKVDFTKYPSANDLATVTLDDAKTTELAKKEENGLVTFTGTGMEPGLYLVKITTDNGNVVYNPMILGVNLQEGDKNPSSTIDLSEARYGESGAAKKSEAKVDKKIVSDSTKPQNENGNDMQIGDEVQFKIDVTIPSYSEAFVDPVCTVTDTLKNLTLKSDTVKVQYGTEDSKIDATLENDYTFENRDHKGFTVAFKPKFIKKHIGQTVSITYSATLDKSAKTNFNGDNKNEVIYEFSNNPYNKDDKGKDEDITHHYTFEIDGTVNGNLKSHEFIKTGSGLAVDKETKYIRNGALEGAKFQLYTDENCKTAFRDEVTTDDKGKINIKGLKGNTIYYLKETFAPSPYKIDDRVIKIKVVPEFQDDGTLNKYHFEITEGDNKVTCTEYTATYNNEGSVEVTGDDGDTPEDHTFEFINTKSPQLPSTGGMGTYLFTITGVAVIAVAAGLFLRKRDKE